MTKLQFHIKLEAIECLFFVVAEKSAKNLTCSL